MSSWSSDMWFDMAVAEMEAKGITGYVLMPHQMVVKRKTSPRCRICGGPRKKRCQHCAECIAAAIHISARKTV
jgi:hypothetical protein